MEKFGSLIIIQKPLSQWKSGFFKLQYFPNDLRYEAEFLYVDRNL